jgi:hypothetical protein
MRQFDDNLVALTLVTSTILALMALNVVSAFISPFKTGYDPKLSDKTLFGDLNISTNLANENISKNLSRVIISSLPNMTAIPH